MQLRHRYRRLPPSVRGLVPLPRRCRRVLHQSPQRLRRLHPISLLYRCWPRLHRRLRDWYPYQARHPLTSLVSHLRNRFHPLFHPRRRHPKYPSWSGRTPISWSHLTRTMRLQWAVTTSRRKILPGSLQFRTRLLREVEQRWTRGLLEEPQLKRWPRSAVVVAVLVDYDRESR